MYRTRLTIFLLLLFIVSCKDQSKKETKNLSVNEPGTSQAKTEVDNSSKNSFTTEKKTTTRLKKIKTAKFVTTDNPILFDKKAQTFIINQKSDTTLYGAEGTIIKISRRSFVYEDGNEPEQVIINIKEFYKFDDIIFAKLTTRSGENILETGGMIFIEAVSEKRECKLKDNASFELSFPHDTKKENMQLFSGNWKNGNIDWVVEQTDTSSYLPISKIAWFPGGDQKLRKFIEERLEYPESLIEQGMNARLIVRFVVDPLGNVTNVRIDNSPHKLFSENVQRIFSIMPKWEPAIEKGRPTNSSFTHVIYFYSGINQEMTFDTLYKAGFEQRTNEATINKLEIVEIERYVFSSSKLGWINCDRFYKIEGPKTDLFVRTDFYPNADVRIVFHNFNGILEGEKTSLGHVFKGIPSGEKITVLAIAKQNDKNFISLSESTTSSSLNELAFEQVTMDVLKQKVAQLNDLRK